MPIGNVIAWVIFTLCAAASFFFALAECAFFSIPKWRVAELGATTGASGRRLMALLEQPKDLLAAVVFGNTSANTTMVAAFIWGATSWNLSFWITLPILVLLVLIVCEVLPKTLGVRSPEFWAALLAVPIHWSIRMTLPFRRGSQKLGEAIIQGLTPRNFVHTRGFTDEEIPELLKTAQDEGALAESQREMIQRIIQLDQRTAREVMKPRARMYCLPDDLTTEEMISEARRLKRTRVPIYDSTPDTIVGILNARALILDPTHDLADAIEFPSFVPDSMNLLQLLQSLQKQKRGMAIVIDEFGATLGLITLADIVDEVVGGIQDVESGSGFIMERLKAGHWRVSGTMRIDDFRREHPAIGEVDEVETMGGLLMRELEAVPIPGESALFRGLKLTAKITDERHVREILVEQTKT